ncbi:MAG: hypothetical protein ACEPOZ_12240 [Marinifilaceae bacterium]|jgi:hypothetical protein
MSNTEILDNTRKIFFIQPPSRNVIRFGKEVKGNSILGIKCYAYATFNALATGNLLPEAEKFSNQTEIDSWISNLEYALGGTPYKIIKKLKEEKICNYTIKSLYDIDASTLARSLQEYFAITIGVKVKTTNIKSKKTNTSNHWIYGIDRSKNSISAIDQQNSHRGVILFSFDKKNKKWLGYCQNKSKIVEIEYEITQVMVIC